MRLLFITLGFMMAAIGHSQTRPDMAVMAIRSVSAKGNSITITRNGRAYTSLVKNDGFWMIKGEEIYLDTLDWYGWEPADEDVIAAARFSSDPTPRATFSQESRFSVYRALVQYGENKKSQRLVFDYSGRLHQVYWIVVNNPGKAIPLATHNPLVRSENENEVQMADFTWNGNRLMSFSNLDDGTIWNFVYDRAGRLTEIRGTEEGKTARYRFTYR